MTTNVQRLCEEIWRARDAGVLTRDDVLLSQQMYVAVAADIAERDDLKYDPEMDRRIEWMREVIRKVRMLRPGLKPLAEGPLEDLIQWMLFQTQNERPVSWKELAAGTA